ncbi:unnamed protein product, partial [Musa hybrid cultivar]
KEVSENCSFYSNPQDQNSCRKLITFVLRKGGIFFFLDNKEP